MESLTPHYFDGTWRSSDGDRLTSINPSTGEAIWWGNVADGASVDAAVHAAREAFGPWAAKSFDERAALLERYADLLRERGSAIAEAISQEVGKPPYEAAGEVAAMTNKIAISIEAHRTRNASFGKAGAMTSFRPHGVVAVLGPFNFPGHLPNGHIVPALLAGNTVIFKPSDQAPRVAEVTMKIWDEVGLPAGVLNLLQGGVSTAVALSGHREIDGVFFTGSSKVGIALNKAFASQPGKILALEMGGNNPLVVHDPGNLEGAAYLAAQSAFATAGQRCTCARRLIVTSFPERDAFLEHLLAITKGLVVGPPTADPQPYMGPVISETAAENCLAFQDELIDRGGKEILLARHLQDGTGLVSPGLVDVTDAREVPDEEVFGPLLQVCRVETLDDAIAEANRTRYGLAAGLLSRSEEAWATFRAQARAGIVNWNKPLTGASSAAPFGGIGLSGNHRPSAFLAADYCAYPVASMEAPEPSLPEKPLPGLAWS